MSWMSLMAGVLRGLLRRCVVVFSSFSSFSCFPFFSFPFFLSFPPCFLLPFFFLFTFFYLLLFFSSQFLSFCLFSFLAIVISPSKPNILTQLQANAAMGIRFGPSKDNMTLPMFSDDILKVEISGPEVCWLGFLDPSLEGSKRFGLTLCPWQRPHLTVIDVPGLFQVTDEGQLY